jgi:enoyl-CoA hydratase/carnithine racemase
LRQQRGVEFSTASYVDWRSHRRLLGTTTTGRRGYNGPVGYQQILYEVTDPVATITLNRPESLNAWTGRMGHEVADAMAQAEADPTVVGIILTGAGRGFCAGADMKMLQGITGGDQNTTASDEEAEAILSAGDQLPGDASLSELRDVYTYPMSMRKPVIAAINGAAAGMAVPIALACDLRFMNQDAVLTTSFAQRGLIAEWGIAWLLGRLVGPSVALDLLFSARKVSGTEAAQVGLVNRALPAEEVVPAARDYIVDLARNCSPASIAVMKRQVYLDLHRGLGAATEEATRLMHESFGRVDFAEGVRSYVQRRAPEFPRVAGDVAG